MLLVGIVTTVCTVQAATIDFTDRDTFASVTNNSITIGFSSILSHGVTFKDFNPLVVSGVNFSTPTPNTFVNVTAATYYSPNNYTADFIVNSVNLGPNNELIISLPHPTNALGLDYGGLGFTGEGAATITLSNGHVFTQTSLPTVGHTAFVGFVSTDPITTLTLVTTNDSWVVEDLVMANPQIPAPNPYQAWTQLAPVGALPSPRGGFGGEAGFDPASDRMIIFGGNANVNDVWVLVNANGLGGSPQWVNLSPAPDPVFGLPPGRSEHSTIYDPGSNSLVIMDGCAGNCLPILNDLWVLTNANGLGGTPAWIKMVPTGGPPPARANHTAVYDAVSNSMIVFGGQNGCCNPAIAFSDVWVLTNANGLGGTPTWTQLTPTGRPPLGHTDHTAIYDPASNRMTVFGGLPNRSNSPTNAVWVLSNANGQGGTPVWTNLVAEGAPGAPPVRDEHSAVYDATTNRMTIFGGANAATLYNDVWVLTNANGLGGTPTWTQLTPTGGPPPARLSHTAILHVASNRMTIFGGESSTADLNDTWVLGAQQAAFPSRGIFVIGDETDTGEVTW
jgi:hypothetical protein